MGDAIILQFLQDSDKKNWNLKTVSSQLRNFLYVLSVYSLNLLGRNDGVRYRAAFGNTGLFEQHRAELLQAAYSSNVPSQFTLRHPRGNAVRSRAAAHSVLDAAELWPTVCGEDKDGFKDNEEGGSGGEFVWQQV